MAESTRAQLAHITESLARIEATLETREPRLPVDTIRHVIEETSATAEAVQELAGAVPAAAQQLTQIASTLDAQMTDDELRRELRNALSYIRQFTSVMQGTRDDIVALRGDFRRLAALLEQTLHVRIEDEERGIVWRTGDADRRKAS